MPSSSPTRTIATPEAYIKSMLHCLKYPTQAVSGFLLGKRLTADGTIFVTDAIPLFHTLPMISPHPMLEIALAQVSSHARGNGLNIVGYYAANELLNDATISPLTLRVLGRLMERGGSGSGTATTAGGDSVEGADNGIKSASSTVSGGRGTILLWQVDNLIVGGGDSSSCSKQAIKPFLFSGGTTASPKDLGRTAFGVWNGDVCDAEGVTQEGVLSQLDDAVQSFAHNRLTDFEDHLEDISRNYLQNDLTTTTSGSKKSGSRSS